ncbi:hypothetical protein LINPERHAP1_LOCUS10368 [Linum perenne]
MAANSTTTNKLKITLKLFIDKKTNKVVFAEADKEFVDFLLSILSDHIGTVIRLLSEDQMVGCLGNLYKSCENLNNTFIQPSTTKDTILKPKLQQLCTNESNLLLLDGLSGTPAARRFYKCNKCSSDVTDICSQTCHSCYYAPMNIEGGIVKGSSTYMVMDNLKVMPLSTISIVNLLNEFNVQWVVDLEEKIIELGKDEGLSLLKASLQSKNVLTSVLLGTLKKESALLGA